MKIISTLLKIVWLLCFPAFGLLLGMMFNNSLNHYFVWGFWLFFSIIVFPIVSACIIYIDGSVKQ